MKDKEAILGFMVGERLKSSLIAANSMITLLDTLPQMEKKGAERMLSVYIGYLSNEVVMAGNVTPQNEWPDIAKSLEQAHVKVDSGIPGEATRDVTSAISRAVTVSHRCMAHLQDRGLL